MASGPVGWKYIHYRPAGIQPFRGRRQYTRNNRTHNHHFVSEAGLLNTLTDVFRKMRSCPQLIRPLPPPHC